MSFKVYQLKTKNVIYGVIVTDAEEKDIKNTLKAVKMFSELYVNIDFIEQLVKILRSLDFKAEISFIRDIELEDLSDT